MLSEETDRSTARRLRVLVVDDSALIRRIARRMLEAGGFAVQEAGNGALALVACHAGMPDAILLDWNMPVMDGMEFLTELRAQCPAPMPKVIFCTTENDSDFIMRAMDAGADEFIMKPFDQDILLGKFQQVGLQ
jgi:two-component system chemotaxis response regulator CheY